MSADPSTEAIYEAHGDYLWGLAFRMLGVRADADEVVQDAFVRLLRAEPDRTAAMRPWLVRVTMNLARDRLRARKRETYIGPWLPAVTDLGTGEPASLPGARYTGVESLSLGFLWAAEQLDDVQRGVLVLRDVLGHSVRETAAALELSESNVKVITHRVRGRMREWEASQRRSLAVPHEQVIDAMRRFFGSVAAGEREEAEAALAEDVRMLSDGGDEFFAARKPVVGAAKVAGFYVKIAAGEVAAPTLEIRTLGGMPTLIVRRPKAKDNNAPAACIQVELNESGRISRIYSVLATAKVRGMLSDRARSGCPS
ncbi:MAG: sigma factor [Nannocystales bacterium]